jgi:hypothetical protein
VIGALLGVLAQVGAAAEPAVVARARVPADAPVSVHALVEPARVVIGEAAAYELAVFIADEVRQRLRRNPEYVPPDLRGVLAYDLDGRGGPRLVQRNGRTYEVHVFRRALVPVATGALDIPPARLTYYLPQSPSFFSREETRTLYSDPVRLEVRDAPLAGRPAGWTGAVGTFTARWRTLPATARVGEAFVATVRLEGRGNVALLARPPLAAPWATVVDGAERVTLDSTATELRGAKEFDWLVTPSREGDVTMPAVPLSYLDPRAGRYATAIAPAVAVSVGVGDRVAVAGTAPAEAARDPGPRLPAAWRGQRPVPLDARWVTWLAVALAPVPAVVVAWRRRMPRRRRAVPPVAWHALAPDDPHGAVAALRAAVDARLTTVAPLPWADAVALESALRRAGVTAATARAVVDAHRAWDRAAFAGRGRAAGAAAQARTLVRAVDREAVRPARPPRRRWRVRAAGAALLAVVAPTATGGQRAASAAAAFTAAHTALAAGDTGTARARFAAAAAAAPRSVEAWQAVGTLAWAARDTAAAVQAWQRALRLDPLAADPRDALARVGAPQDVGIAAVPPVPRDLPAAVALIAWMAAWLGLARARARGHRARWAVVVLCAALVTGGSAAALRWAIARPGLVVVARPAPLRALPSLGGDGGAVPLTGEVARVVDRRGAWAQVRLDDGRAGWIPADRLLAITGD